MVPPTRLTGQAILAVCRAQCPRAREDQPNDGSHHVFRTGTVPQGKSDELAQRCKLELWSPTLPQRRGKPSYREKGLVIHLRIVGNCICTVRSTEHSVSNKLRPLPSIGYSSFDSDGSSCNGNIPVNSVY